MSKTQMCIVDTQCQYCGHTQETVEPWQHIPICAKCRRRMRPEIMDRAGEDRTMKLDASDPGNAAKVNFAAAWLFAQVSMMNAFNAEREHQGYAAGYDEVMYQAAIKDARKIAAGEDVEP